MYGKTIFLVKSDIFIFLKELYVAYFFWLTPYSWRVEELKGEDFVTTWLKKYNIYDSIIYLVFSLVILVAFRKNILHLSANY